MDRERNDVASTSEPRGAFSHRGRIDIVSTSDTSDTGRHDFASSEPKSKITKNDSTNSIYELPTPPKPPGARPKIRPPGPPLPPSIPDQPLPKIPPKTGQKNEVPLAIMNPSFQSDFIQLPIKPERKQIKRHNFGKFYI